MQKVVIIEQADYVALRNAINDAYVNVRGLEESYHKSEILRKLDDARDLLQMED